MNMYTEDTDLLDHPNVSLAEAIVNKYPGAKILFRQQSTSSHKLIDLIKLVLVEKPTWMVSIVAARPDRNDGPPFNLHPECFRLESNGDFLGQVSMHYRSGYGYVYEVGNQRIADGYERASSLKTADIKRAITTIKKKFYARTPLEVLEDTNKAAKRMAQHQAWDTSRTFDSLMRNIRDKATDFVMGPGWQQFLDYVSESGIASAQVKASIHKLLEGREEEGLKKVAASEIHDKFDRNEGLLVVQTGNRYMVCPMHSQQYEHYADDTLPENIRMKLGLLKLVEEGFLVGNIGVRVSKNTFALTTEVQ
jgi:hypothetical protein